MRSPSLTPIAAFPPAPVARVQTRQKNLLDPETLQALSAECGYNATALAARLGISIRQLQRRFARQLGCAPRAWLREERLQAAHCLVLRAGTIKEVAFALSFRRESHFSREFRYRFGYSPSTLRNTPQPRSVAPRPSLLLRASHTSD